DYCFQGLCRNKGKCIDLKDGYRCECQEGFSGKTCKIEDACSSRPCLNDGMCALDGTSYKCNCVKGFTGATCGKEGGFGFYF
ncbi:hypothetical protein HELRODRAFT_79117, partial [Helobdella robusta]|uniref:EGF-like domain-containing protein n=1 Tax=Helobdella robusta TaxID=6412 RepID=T1G3K4_HELRO